MTSDAGGAPYDIQPGDGVHPGKPVIVNRYTVGARINHWITATSLVLLALSGLRSPYTGKLGVVEEGALADLVLVDGNPLENIKLIENPAKNFLVIMKDGKVYKNLPGR